MFYDIKYITQFRSFHDVPKEQIIESALEFMKQNKSNDLEVSDLLTEEVEIDELARHVYYTAKAIRRLTLSEVKSPVPAKMKGCFPNVYLTFFFKYKNFNFGSQNIKRSVKYKKNMHC
jgi:hypothetical protein